MFKTWFLRGICGIIIIEISHFETLLTHIYVLKKQIQKNIAKYVLSSLILIILAPIFLVSIISPHPAVAQATCTINPNPALSKAPRPVEQMVMQISDAPSPRIANSGFTGTFEILFKSEDQYRLSGCESQITVTARIDSSFLSIVPGTSGIRPIAEPIPTTDLKVTHQAGALRVSGKFTVPDLAVKLNPDIAAEVKSKWLPEDPYDSFVVIRVAEAGAEWSYRTTDVAQSEVGLFGCVNKEMVCQSHKGGAMGTVDPTSGNDNDIKLNDLRFKISTALTGDNLQFSPESRKGKDIHNFVRLYVDASGNIKGFGMQSNIFLSAPADKTLNINNNGQTSQMFLTTDTSGTIVKKKAMFVGTGVTNPKESFRSSSDHGCIGGETSTHYFPLSGNVTRVFNLCNPVAFVTSKSVALKAGGDGFDFSLNLGNKELRQLKTLTIVKCQDDKAGTGCDESVNIVDVGAVFGLEENVVSDTSGPFTKAFLALMTGGIYPLAEGYSMIKQQWAFLDGLPITGNPQNKFYIQIYPTETAWKENIDKAPIPSSVPEPQEIETSVGTKDDSVTSLYDFIVRVISQIVIWLTALIYKIFAFFIVPVLNALLKVRPYQDAFVNIIYPGWLILRNMANIFFIISLLVVGLRILFQQSAAATARGFIMRLIIMALLVNFSLVIAQGIVGIADTVQSQFMPQNTRIIEALGQKLMVEPIQSFRSAVTGPDKTIEQDVTISDTAKPIILLVLAIAAFFSFVAIAAFLAIRLVALLVLYMVSPIAYVGYVMDDTKKYAGQWWSEFIKYAFLTPILVFFLNIAALVATTFSSKTGDVINIDAGLSGDLVSGGLTIATHFIVLLFIFAGMKYAQSSGTIGSKAIVDYAKKGFDALTTRPAKWAAGAAGDLAKNAAKEQYARRIKDGLLDPLAWRDAYKKRVADATKDKYSARVGNKADKLSPHGFFQDPAKSLKYLMYKGIGQDPQNYRDARDTKQDEANILTDSERQNLENKYRIESGRLGPLENIQSSLAANSPLSVTQGQVLLNRLRNEKDRLNVDAVRDVNALRNEASALAAQGNYAGAQNKRNEATALAGEYRKKMKDINDIQEDIEPIVSRAITNGATVIALDDSLKDRITNKLDDDIKDLVKEIDQLAKDRTNDDRRLGEFGGGPMTSDRKRTLLNDISKLEKEAEDRSAPRSSFARRVRREKEEEEKKKVEDTDDPEELIAQYKKAMGKNNLPLATAIAKKIASEGSFDDLLKEFGYRNNMKAAQEFFGEQFKKYAPSVRLQIMSEVGMINEKNGNRSASRLTKMDKDTGQMRLATTQEHHTKHNSKLSKKALSEAKKMKKNEFGEIGSDGRLRLYDGAAKLLSQFKTIKRPEPDPRTGRISQDQKEKYDRRIAEYRRDMGPNARAILEAPNSSLINDEALRVIRDIAS